MTAGSRASPKRTVFTGGNDGYGLAGPSTAAKQAPQAIERLQRLFRAELGGIDRRERRLDVGPRRLAGGGSRFRPGGAEQRQIVGEPRRGIGLFASLENLQDLFGPGDDRRRQTGEPRDVDAVRAVRGPRCHLVVKPYAVLPFLDPIGPAAQPLLARVPAAQL